MPNPGLATTEEIIEAYKVTGSVWKAAKRLGLCGQSVWERLKKMQYPLPGTRWTDDELEECRRLASQCPLSEIAKRIGRPYAAVASKMSQLGLTNLFKNNRTPKSLRGTGLTAPIVRKYAKELAAFSGTLGAFCRQRGMSIDTFAKAVQIHTPDAWTEYVRTHAACAPKRCGYCQSEFFPMTKKQATCSRRCQAHARADKQYFNGQRRNTIGLASGICQLCLRERKSLSSHHVWGKENDPGAEFLIAVCAGCHQLVGRLASTKIGGDREFLERLIIFAQMRRLGDKKPIGFHCIVDLDELSPEEAEECAW